MTDPIVIVGAGAAGLMAAAELVAAGRPAILIERGDRPGRKVLVSGGGRCNLTHDAAPEVLLATFDRPAARFLKHAVYDLPPEALRAWLADHGLATVVESDGCVFPASHRSKDVLDTLLRAAGGAELRTGVACRRVVVEGGCAVGVETSAGTVAASAVILAAGGPAWPAAGGTASGHELLAALGHTIVAPRPGLAPLVIAEPWVRGLQGVSLADAELTVERRSPGGKRERFTARGPLVFTHEGLSGPAALDVSSHLDPGATAAVVCRRADRETPHGCTQRSRGTQSASPAPAAEGTTVRLSLLPGCAADEVERQLVAAAKADGSQMVRAVVAKWSEQRGCHPQAKLVGDRTPGEEAPTNEVCGWHPAGTGLPRSVIEQLLRVAGTAPATQAGQLTRYTRERLAELLTAAPLAASVAGGWDQAMVTVGGCELSEVNSRTMESRTVAGLYVVGELLDVAGPTGGYNLHAAFATARLAARAILNKM